MMTDKAKRLVSALRARCAEQADCNTCPINEYCFHDGMRTMRNEAADLIESLAAELEQVKRERDAAVEDLKLWFCFSCKNQLTPFCQECSCNRVRLIKGYLSGRNHYEWRGVKED